MQDIKEKIKVFLSKFFRKREQNDDEDIFATGAVNSLFAMQLILFLEKEFNIRVENSDMDIENFKTINSISRFVAKKIA